MTLDSFAFLMLVISMACFLWALIRTVNMVVRTVNIVDRLHKRIARLEAKQWEVGPGTYWKQEENNGT